ncbi:MAG TPA: hypothetical protein VD966_02435 [Pyrinomonadaceae bacterium]|nr:hypothetical protein [Pyrinomonadaceae bacterium]
MKDENFRRSPGQVVRQATLTALLLLSLATLARAQTVQLEHGWQFAADKSAAFRIEQLPGAQAWRPARVGLSWNAQFADLRDYMGVAWYRTRFEVPQWSAPRRTIIRFGAVDYFCEVFVNGKSVGTHEGGYTPFSFDLTEAVRTGSNELVVRVLDPPMNERGTTPPFPEMPYNEIPHGKQNWYVQTGGIWQPVTLEFRPSLYIERVRVTPSINGEVSVEVRLAGAAPQDPNPIEVLVRNASGGVEFREGGGGITTTSPRVFRGRVKSPQLWSPRSPTLYTVEVTLNGGEDYARERFGFRQFETRNGQFFLNGQPYYMIAALDQDFYPDTIYTPPSEEYVREMMLKARRLGLNMLRCHIKVPDPIYLKAADEVGMLVWYEIPSWNDFNHFSPQAAERGEKIFSEMVARDWNHPSVVILSIINEGWGTDLRQAEQRRWLRAAFDRAKRLVEPRGVLVVDNSPCCENFHLRTDIDDFHRYNSIPDQHQDFDRWVAEFAARPPWSFSPHGDAERSGREPLVVSEFGNWGLPRLPGELPWWFDRDFAGREVTRPAGVLERFRQFQFSRLFSDFNALAEATQWHQFISLKHEIEEMRRYGSIQGYVITEFTDINWEVNGLMDMWRQPKVYADELSRIQQPDVILARLPKRGFTSGERVKIETLLSHYGERELDGVTVRWWSGTGAGEEFRLERRFPRGSVEPLQPITFPAPGVERPRRERLRLEARARDGSLLAENSYDIFVYPRPAPATNLSLVFHDPAGSHTSLRQSLATAGYNVSATGNINNNALIIATRLDERVERHLQSGGRAVILIDSPEALPATSALKAVPRAGSDLSGDWVTNFNWVRLDAAPFSEVAFTPILGFESARVVPRHVIQGMRGEDYGDVLSGIFYGWLNNNSALAMQVRAGAGRAFLTTFRFGEYGSDPYATHLLDAIIRYASGPSFAPRLEWRRKADKS